MVSKWNPLKIKSDFIFCNTSHLEAINLEKSTYDLHWAIADPWIVYSLSHRKPGFFQPFEDKEYVFFIAELPPGPSAVAYKNYLIFVILS